MKVHESQGLILDQIPKKKTATDAGEKPFRQIMDEVTPEKVLDESGSNRALSEFVPEGVQIISPPEMVQFSQISEKDSLLNELEQTLNLVDFFASKLAGQSFPYPEMESLLNHLEERMKGFQDLESQPGIPDKLRSVLSDTVVTIATETAKFRRGDYT